MPKDQTIIKESCNTFAFTEEAARTVLNSLSAHIAILDRDGVILETNRAWREFALHSGMPAEYDECGQNYLSICRSVQGADEEMAHTASKGIQSVIDGQTEEFVFDYPCHSPDSRHWYNMRAVRITGEGPMKIVVSHEEITPLKKAEEALRKSREELSNQKLNLEEANIALKVLLKQRERDKDELEEKVLGNIKELVLPYVEKLKRAKLKSATKTLVEIVDTHLNDIISPLLQSLSNAGILLTPQEMQVATLVKDGKSSKEIAGILNISQTTVHFHRKNLRKKFNLSNTRTNLRSYLQTLT